MLNSMIRPVLLSLALVAVAGCTRGGQQSNNDSPREKKAGLKSASQIDPDWLEGKLPKEVNEGTPRMGGTLVVRMHSEPPSLDRITDSDMVTALMLDRKVLQGMAELDASKHPDYPLKPVLAESWEQSDDGKTFTFHIRRNVKWHDGQPFSGKDVVATYETIMNPKVRAMHLRNYFEPFTSVKTLPGDDFTVVAKVDEPYFLAFRSLATLPIYPKHILDVAGDLVSHDIHRAPVGTGPFKFEKWDTVNKRITLVRNEDYWGRKAYLDKVIYRLVVEPTVAFQLLQQGDFDLFTNTQPAAWAKEMENIPFLVDNFNRSKFYDANYSWIGWNTKRPFFQDKRVRQAMTYLLDSEGMRQRFLLGIDRPTTCHFYLESNACDPTLEPRKHDREKAIALLDEAGWVDTDGDGIRDKDGVPFKTTFLITSASTFLGKLAPYMQQELKKVGIQLDIKKVEWPLYTQMLRNHDFDICSLLWGSSDVVGDPYQIWHSSQASEGSNFISYKNPEVDALIEQARGEMDAEKRGELYRKFGRILYEENPYTFLYNRPSLDVIRKNVRGVRPSIPWYDLQDVWLADAPGPEVKTADAADNTESEPAAAK